MNYSKTQLFALVLLRVFIGWHFLYEGLLKLFNPAWSSKGYLLSSDGFLSGFFGWLASDAMIGLTDILTVVLLLGAGLTLILGIFTRLGAFAGVVLLLLFYLAHPSLPGLESAAPVEGNYWIVNKNLVELAALLVVWFFPTSHLVGLHMYLKKGKQPQAATS